MKILHTADWHLGRVLHGVSLEEYQQQFLEFFVDLVKVEQPDAVIIAGDVFDRSVAPVTALSMMDHVLRQLAELTRVILIPGNHDSAARLGYGASLYDQRVTVVSSFEQVGSPVVLESTDTVLNVYPVPYLEPDLARYAFLDDAGEPCGRSHQAVNSAAAELIFKDLAARSGIGLVLAHPFVAGSLTSESERDISVGGVQSIAVETFMDPGQRIRYVACGHLHRPQTLTVSGVAEDAYCVRYSGSPLPFSFSEATDLKTITRLEVSGEQLLWSEIAVPQSYGLRTFTGELAELLAADLETIDTFWSVEITDAVRPENLFAQVKDKLPGLLALKHVERGSFTAATELKLREISVQQVSSEFFRRALGRDLEAAEMQVIAEIWEHLRAAEVEA